VAPSWELHRVLAVEKVPQAGGLAPRSRLCRRLGVFGRRWLCCCRWWRMLLRFLALRSLVPSCRLGSSSSLEACCGCRGRRGFDWWVDTLDRRGGLVGVSALAAPCRVIEIQGFDVELLEGVEVHRRVEWVRVQLCPPSEQHCELICHPIRGDRPISFCDPHPRSCHALGGICRGGRAWFPWRSHRSIFRLCRRAPESPLLS
jgi:hypothetical protein